MGTAMRKTRRVSLLLLPIEMARNGGITPGAVGVSAALKPLMAPTLLYGKTGAARCGLQNMIRTGLSKLVALAALQVQRVISRLNPTSIRTSIVTQSPVRL